VYNSSNNTVSLLSNGQAISSGALSGTVAAWVSGGVPQIGLTFKGKIDEVLVRNIAATTFSSYTDNSVVSGTIGLWHFNEGTGSTSADSSSYAKTATLVSNTWANSNGEVGVGKYDRDFRSGYDKVGNRTNMRLINQTGTVSHDISWQMVYNVYNQLTQRHNGTAGQWDSGTERYTYTYDSNGNQTQVKKETKSGSTWTQVELWNFTWNIKNEMTQAERRTGTGSGNYAGKEMYEYCLSCGGAMSVWKTFGAGNTTYPTSWRRYEYDGLNILRIDDRCDDDLDGIIEINETTWRTLEVSTHKPGSLGALIGKRVYTHTNNDATPDATNDYTYTYDAVGNVLAIYNANSSGRGNELYYFTQDAFGNELTTSPFSGTVWTTARNAGITEHQTGKWIDPFTGLYYFHARWYDSGVGRWISKESSIYPYIFNYDSPTNRVDRDGNDSVAVCYRDVEPSCRGALTCGDTGEALIRPFVNLNGHCYIRLIKDRMVARCGINWGGGTRPDHKGTWPEGFYCYPIDTVNMSCVIEAIRRVEKGSDPGITVPGFEQDKWTINNNCCTAVWNVINSCRKRIPQEITPPTFPGQPPYIPEPIWEPIDDPTIPDVGGDSSSPECLKPIVGPAVTH